MPLSSAYQQQQQLQQKRAAGVVQPTPAAPGTQTAPRNREQQAQPTQQYQVAPDPATWDYRTSPVNLKGEALPAGAKSWTPFGQPYFGKGLSGTLKKYAWSLMGSPVQGGEADRWARFVELTSTAPGVYSPEGRTPEAGKKSAEATKLFFQGLVGTSATQETAGQDWNAVKQANARIQQITQQYRGPNGVNLNAMPDNVRAEFQKLQETIKGSSVSAAKGATSFQVGGQNISLLSPLLRVSKVG